MFIEVLLLVAIVAGISWYMLASKKAKNAPPLVTGYGSIPIISPLIGIASDPRSLFAYCRKTYKDAGMARLSVFGFLNVHIVFGLPHMDAFFRSHESELSLTQAANFAVGPLLGLDEREADLQKQRKLAKAMHNSAVPKNAEEESDHNTAWIKESITKPDSLDYLNVKAQKIIDKFMAKWSKQKKPTFDLFKEIYNLVVLINIHCFVGDDVAEYADEMVELLYIIENHGTHINSMFNPYSMQRKLSVNARLRIVEIIKTLRTRREERLQAGERDENGDDVLQVLIDGENSDVQIVSSLLGIFFAAQTNTVSTTAWTLAHLAEDKKWQDKCREEVMQKAPKDRPMTFNSLKELEVLGACTSETVRKNAVAFVFRKALKDVTIDKYKIKKGDFCIVSPSVAHTNEEIFPEPEKWKPERFFTEDNKVRNNFGRSFIQWGFFSHRCLGEHFATMVMRSTTAKLLREYTLDIDRMAKLDYSKALGMPFAEGVMHMTLTPIEPRN